MRCPGDRNNPNWKCIARDTYFFDDDTRIGSTKNNKDDHKPAHHRMKPIYWNSEGKIMIKKEWDVQLTKIKGKKLLESFIWAQPEW